MQATAVPYEDPFSPRGPVIGRYLDRPIHDTITVEGEVLRYDRVAVQCRGGEIPLDQLAEGEVVVAPGLIYGPVGRAPC